MDVCLYWLLNVTSAFMLSAAHNVLFFVLDVRAICHHFLHYMCCFLFLFFAYSRLANLAIPAVLLSQTLLAPVICQVVVSGLSAWVHSGNRTGSLYLLRLFDFVTTMVAMYLAPRLLTPNYQVRNAWKLMFPLAISASLCWLEFEHIEYDSMALILAPLLAVARGVNVVVLKKSVHAFLAFSPHAVFELYALFYCGLVAMGLALPAFVSYRQIDIPYDASWESIDYILMAMSFVFMACFKFSELWLLFNVDLPTYLALDHTKYFAASIGQWFLQNMAHATIYAFIGKMLFVTSSFRFWHDYFFVKNGVGSRKEMVE